MATQAYIDDGYTEQGYLQEVRGIHQACRFTYRPVMPGDMRETLHHWAEISATEKTERIYETLRKHLIKWDFEYDKKILPIEVVTLERLKQPFVDRIFNIITCSDISDERKDKQASAEDDAKN